MTPIQEIERDLDWRESELAVLKLLLLDGDISKKTKLVLYRAGWALLYAHFEGFSKFALTVFYDALQEKSLTCKDLPPRTQAFALSKSLSDIRNLPKLDLVHCLRNFEGTVMDEYVTFPEVNTKSNLWPTTLKELLEDADLTVKTLEEHFHTIKTLVSRRNSIAHGEKEIITEFDYFKKMDDAARDIMYELALAIDEKLSLHPGYAR